MSVRAVLFDLGGTLVSYYDVAQFEPILCRSLEACLGVPGIVMTSPREELLQSALRIDKGRADDSVWPLRERLALLFGVAADDAQLLDSLCTAFLGPIFATAILDPHARLVLKALKDRGIKTAIVSNTPWGSSSEAWRAELAGHGLLDLVDAAVFCHDVGWRKPHPAPFLHALKLLDVRADEALFVGDDPRWDVAGARRSGLTPVLIDRDRRKHDLPPDVKIVASLDEVLGLLTPREPST